MGFRAGLEDVEKRKLLTTPGLEIRPLCRPAHSQSLSRLLLLIKVCLKIMPGNSIPQFDFQFPNLKNQNGDHADFFVVRALMPFIVNSRWKNNWKYGGL
jgi:hypothetical protein